MFDLNDFDETLPGPWEWDLKRLAASFEVATRDRDFNRATRREIVLSAAEGYRLAMLEFAERRNLEVWYARLDADELFAQLSAHASTGTRERLSEALTRAGAKTSLQALAKLTITVKGEVRFAHQPPLLVPLGELLRGRAFHHADALLRRVLAQYGRTLPDDRRRLLEQYRLVDFARKVVGVGSVGTRAFVALMLGRDDDDPLLLQFKEAERSVLEPVVGASEYANHGQRVVEGQRLMQAASDILLGFCRVRGLDKRQHDYYVRQLWDGKASADPATARASLFSPYARACGWALARAHARSGDRIAIAAYLGKRSSFDEAVAEFARHYADQNERDFDEFKKAVKRGRLVAEPSVSAAGT